MQQQISFSQNQMQPLSQNYQVQRQIPLSQNQMQQIPLHFESDSHTPFTLSRHDADPKMLYPQPDPHIARTSSPDPSMLGLHHYNSAQDGRL